MSNFDWFTTCLLNNKKTNGGSSASRDVLAKAKQADELDSRCLDLKATFLPPLYSEGSAMKWPLHW